MKTTFAWSVAVGALLLLAPVKAQSAPSAPANVTANPNIVLAAQGCGRGFHRGPYGHCRRNLSPRWACWWRRGPYGHWHLICH